MTFSEALTHVMSDPGARKAYGESVAARNDEQRSREFAETIPVNREDMQALTSEFNAAVKAEMDRQGCTWEQALQAVASDKKFAKKYSRLMGGY